jgi:hypothetical protein
MTEKSVGKAENVRASSQFAFSGCSFRTRKSSSFEISLLFAGPYKFHFESEIVPLSHALKTYYLSALPQQPVG